jgi:hypothetical protein
VPTAGARGVGELKRIFYPEKLVRRGNNSDVSVKYKTLHFEKATVTVSVSIINEA